MLGGKSMKVSNENIEKARKLLTELETLEEAMEVMRNYDAKIFALFWSAYNDNTKQTREVRVQLSRELREQIMDEVQDKIFAIKKELEQL